MKWLHALAAIVGLALSALIVVLVFGAADEQGSSQSGDAPGQAAQDSAGSCGSYGPAEAASATRVAEAARRPPATLDGKGDSAQPKDKAQKAWIARVHAALGQCTEELTVGRNIRVSAAFPDDTSTSDAQQYAFQFLVESFKPPLGPRQVELEVTQGDVTRTLLVRPNVWQAYLQQFGATVAPGSFDQLMAFTRRVKYTPQEATFTGW